MNVVRATSAPAHENQSFLEAVLATFNGARAGCLYSFMYGETLSENDTIRSGEQWHEFLEQTKDYYLLHEEEGVIAKAESVLSSVIPAGFVSRELAVGDAAATKIKSIPFNEAIRPSRYDALDINPDYAESAAINVGRTLGIVSRGIEADIIDGSPMRISEPAVYSLFGGLLANLPAVKGVSHLDMLVSYMSRLRQMMNRGDYFVITQDACHDQDKLRKAYNDPLLAVCALSILQRIKRDLPTKGFDPANFEYEGIFFPKSENQVLCVRSKTIQVFQIAGQSIVLKAGQVVPLINSYKFLPMDFAGAARKAGFKPVAEIVRYKDSNMHILRVA